MPCTRIRTDNLLYIEESKTEWDKVELHKPRYFLDRDEVKDWFAEQAGQYYSEAGPTMVAGVSVYRLWFSDPNTAFAYKHRWG